VVGVFVSDQNRIDRSQIFADRSKPLDDLAPADTGIDQNARAVSSDKYGVSGTAAGEDANFDDEEDSLVL
jgi:hypothetical protein